MIFFAVFGDLCTIVKDKKSCEHFEKAESITNRLSVSIVILIRN